MGVLQTTGVMMRRFFQDRRASVTMLFGLTLVGIVVGVGCAVDYSQAARSRTHIATSADAAALSAAKAAQTYMNTNGTNAASFTAASALAQTAMTQTFAANQASDSYSQGVTATLVMSQDVDGSPIAQVRAKASTPTLFMRILGISNVAVAASAQAKGAGGTYYQIVFVVDVSNSMAIGGTAQDITNLQNDLYIATGNSDGTYTRCAFACHDPNGQRLSYASDYCSASTTDYFCHARGPFYCPWGANNCTRVKTASFSDKRAIAKQYGYKLKIDYVNDAISAFVSQLKPLMDKAPQYYSVGIDTFGTVFTQLQTLTSDSTALQASASKIDIETAISSTANYGFTYTAAGLQSAFSNISNIGDGSSPTKRKTFFIFLSDGAEDVSSTEWPYNRTVDVNYASVCAAIKANGGSNNVNSRPVIFSIDATYYPVTGDAQYQQLISGKGLDTQFPITMQNCATTTSQYQTYFSASDGPSIKAAVQQVFSNIFGVGTLHLSR